MLASIGSVGTATAGPWSRRGRGPRRPGRVAGVLGAAAALAIVLSACTSAQPSSSASASAPGSRPVAVPGMSCAWPTELDIQADNSMIPNAVSVDAASAVWFQPIVASAGTRIVLSGRFPDARYASFSVYTPRGGLFTSPGVGGSLPDYRIVPQPGSVNPWQREAAPGGRFTVTIGSNLSPGQANALPLPPGTTSPRPGYLVYRVYLPAGGDFSAVPLPVLTVEQGRTALVLPACPQHNGKLPVLEGAPAPSGAGTSSTRPAATPPPPLEFYTLPQSFEGSEGVGNADTSYAWAYLIRPPAADVVVVTAKAPTFAPGSHPSPWPAAGEDVRYWSMCILAGTRHTPTVANRLPGGGTDYGCRADQATKLNAAGDYTYVIGSESQRAAISRISGVTFLPFSADQAMRLYVLILRDTLVSTSFAYSPQNVTRAGDPAAAAAAMGPYYPRAAVCPLATLTARGPQACPR
jgi:hypothetical protein